MDGQITIQGGDQWRPFLHVDDAALSVLHTLEAPLGKVHQEVFNVGSNEQNYTIQQAGELIQRIVPDAKLINMGSGGDRRDYKASFNKIRDTLGFMPQWTVEDGIRQVIDVIKRGEVTDYREAKYSNVKYLVEEEDTAQLVRHESSWANDLIAQISLTCQSTVAERQAVIRRSIAVAA
jgi:dTDP-D-glucose 4,6-dehydratase